MQPDTFIDPSLTVPDLLLLKNLLRDIDRHDSSSNESKENGRPYLNGNGNGSLNGVGANRSFSRTADKAPNLNENGHVGSTTLRKPGVDIRKSLIAGNF